MNLKGPALRSRPFLLCASHRVSESAGWALVGCRPAEPTRDDETVTGGAPTASFRCRLASRLLPQTVTLQRLLLLLGLLDLAAGYRGLFWEGLSFFYEDGPIFGDGKFGVE